MGRDPSCTSAEGNHGAAFWWDGDDVVHPGRNMPCQAFRVRRFGLLGTELWCKT
jgi:hypothetical protein